MKRLDEGSTGTCRGHLGTLRGYELHILSRGQPCDRCRDFRNAYMRKQRKKWLSDPEVREHDRIMRRARERARSELTRKYAAEYRLLVRREVARELTQIAEGEEAP